MILTEFQIDSGFISADLGLCLLSFDFICSHVLFELSQGHYLDLGWQLVVQVHNFVQGNMVLTRLGFSEMDHGNFLLWYDKLIQD